MEVKVESLGKVCVTVDKDYWSSEKSYDKLVIVEVAGVGTFISRKPVPARTNINDRIYWIPITVQGGGGGTVPISQDFGDSETITISQKTLTEKVNSLQDKGGYVRFDQNQSESLTEEQKAIARHNIGAEDAITVDNELSDISENPVQNKVVKAAIDNIQGCADKDYNPAEFSGLGKIYLKKNIVEVGGVEKNILTQSAFYKEGTQTPNTDTVFVVQYDFDLNGQTINVPARCVLDFDGGSFNNGKIISNNTEITGIIPTNHDCYYGVFYYNNKPLSHNLNEIKSPSLAILNGFMAPGSYYEMGVWPQGFVAFYHTINNVRKKYYIVMVNRNWDEDANRERAFITLLDENYSLIGSIEMADKSHGSGVVVKDNKLYVGTTVKSNVSGIAVFDINDVFSLCQASSSCRTAYSSGCRSEDP